MVLTKKDLSQIKVLLKGEVDGLAVMVKKGFDETAKKRDLDLLRADLADVKEKLENLEKVTLKQYNFEIQELKRRVKHLEDLFAVK
jgi:DNA-binding transcriptional MerR regulator